MENCPSRPRFIKPGLLGELFVTCYTGYGAEKKEIGEPKDLGRQLLCLDRTNGKTEIVISAPEELFALDPATGKRLWHAATEIPGNIAPSVISAGELLFTTGGWPRKAALVVKGVRKPRRMSFYASILRVGDKLIAVSRRSGTFVFNATPAIVKDALYLEPVPRTPT